MNESEIYQLLKTIKHPEIKEQNLVDLGMIANMFINDEIINITLALPKLDVPIKNDLIDQIRSAIAQSEKNRSVKVELIEMDPQQRKKFFKLSREAQKNVPIKRKVDKIIAVMSGKGGVGKSSMAGLLASSLRRRGFRVGILDADITGPSIPMLFGLKTKPEASEDGIFPVISATGIKIISINLLLPDSDQPVIWRGPLISKTIKQFWEDIIWDDLDYLVVDLPPGTADAALTVMQSLPLDGVLLVTSPQDLAGMVVRKAANMIIMLQIPLLGIIENMSHLICPNCGHRIDIFGPSKTEKTRELVNTQILGNFPIDPSLAVLCDNGSIEKYSSEILESITSQVIDTVST
ncbi:MAG: MRP family ATP-binding protein [Anaerolineaceae bacterium]|nr:MAG: MRP family ATP-binding protein [Anaerolineaceae bacterium]